MNSADATRDPVPTPRRLKTSKPGIYYREDSAGRRRYEYVYRDADGKQRWPGGFRKLDDAQDDRADKLRRIRRGERVAPIRVPFAEFADHWLLSQTQLRASTRARYSWAIRLHLKPQFGRLKVAEITEDHVALLIADMTRKGYEAATIKAVLAPLSLILGRAVRRGALSSNPVAGLERSERPRGRRREMRILQREEIATLIGATGEENRALIATLVFCGLRISEALGLIWADIDLESRSIRVRYQLDHTTRRRVEPKSPNAIRRVVLMPALAKMLVAHRLRAIHSAGTDYVFTTGVGAALNRDNVRSRVLAPAVKRGGLAGDGRPTLRLHDLRHTYASLLIAGGATVVYVSRQMGHGSPAITLTTYSHLFDEHEHADAVSAMLEAGFGPTLQPADNPVASYKSGSRLRAASDA